MCGEVLGREHPTQLGLKQVLSLPKSLTKHFQVMILADTAFGSVEFLHKIRKLKYHAIVGVRYDRQLADGRCLKHLHKRGQQVRFVGVQGTYSNLSDRIFRFSATY